MKDDRALAQRLLRSSSSSMIVGTARPVGGGFSLVDGRRCRGYAVGRAIAYQQNGIWYVRQANVS